MIELARYIEILLLENDCVIVPELGGFIAYHQPAQYEEGEGLYFPPSRMIGFNPQLTMNDGLLVQAYMQTHHTDFPDASRTLSKKVKELKETLYNEGVVEMPGIGVLHYTLHGNYEFHPQKNGVLSPDLYALDAFSITPLSMEVEKDEVLSDGQSVMNFPEKRKVYTLNTRWLSNAVAVAVAVILFFVLSVPVENTYVDKGNYASLGTDCLFDAIRSQSVATVLSVNAVNEPQKSKSAKVVPMVVKVEKVPQPTNVEESPKVEGEPKLAPKVKETPVVKEMPKAEVNKVPAPAVVKSKSKIYHIIVASLATSSDAKRMLQEYKQQGHSSASIQESKGRFRIAINSYEDKSSAYAKLNELKKVDAFKNAWVLTSK